ncbi:MAG TPA: hypothetical protein VMX17_00965 [Candidatus Glassbacteria bacterium]|nr:hypothetical protein [Candidatus Glassbacteria bacterium]
MTPSREYKRQHQFMRNTIIQDIAQLVKTHLFSLEMAVEFQKPIFFGQGIDEQDNRPEVQDVTYSLAIIFHQGMEVERVSLEHIETDKLIEILEGLELSLEAGRKFMEKK